MPTLTAGQAVVAELQAQGVRHIFGIVGHTFLEVLDALYHQASIRYVGVRHEQGGAFMADAYARVTRGPAVCMATAGPGATNLLTGIAGAYVAHSPVVAIVGGPRLAHKGRDSFQELDLVSMFRPVTKLAIQLERADRIPETIRHAFHVATSGRPGPVFIELPRDVLSAKEVAQAPFAQGQVPLSAPDSVAVAEAARLLAHGERPLIIAGGGIHWSNAHSALLSLAEALGAGVVTAYGHNDVFPNAHHLYAGPLGRAGSPEALEACKRADAILAIGTRLGEFTTFYDPKTIRPHVPLVHVDIESRELGRIFPANVRIAADARLTAEALLHHLSKRPDKPAWIQEIGALRLKRAHRLDAYAGWNSTPLKPQRIFAELRRILPPETIVTVDPGAAGAYSYDQLAFELPGTFLSPLNLAGLGFAFPAALGAKVARPDAPVLAIHGDGGFLMNVQELDTAVRCKIPAVTLILNNNSWGSEKGFQRDLQGARYIGCDITNPRYDELARLFGAKGYYVERVADVGSVLQQALRDNLPSLIEIPIDPDELPDQRTI